MDWTGLQRIITPPYARRHPADRLDEAQRLVEVARRLAAQQPEEVEETQVVALAWLVRLGDQLRGNMTLKGAVESFFVERGWPPVRTRLLLRSLERLPGRPESLEEKCVADAVALRELGMVGFVRALSGAGAAGEPLETLLEPLRRRLSARFHTAAGRRAAEEPREELRALLDQLKRVLD